MHCVCHLLLVQEPALLFVKTACTTGIYVAHAVDEPRHPSERTSANRQVMAIGAHGCARPK